MKSILTTSIFLFLIQIQSYAVVDFVEFSKLTNVSLEVFEKLKPSADYRLFINKQPTSYTNTDSKEEKFWWDIDLINASFFKTEAEGYINFYITVFGGFAKQEFMTADALALTLCHELAHGLGVEPKKNNGAVTEGQADYYATNTCLPIFYEIYNSQKIAEPLSPYIEDLCLREDKRGDYNYCVRSLNAINADMQFFKLLGQDSSYDKASTHRPDFFDTSDTYYPDAQCRVDLMIHGSLGLARPNCFDPHGIKRVL